MRRKNTLCCVALASVAACAPMAAGVPAALPSTLAGHQPAADANGRVYVWSLAAGKTRITLRDPLSKDVRAVALSPDGRSAAAGDANGNTYLWDLSHVVRPRRPGPLGPFGYDAHVLAQPDPRRYVRLIADGGATSLRDDITWATIEPTRGRFNWSKTDELVTLAAAHHLHVLMIVDTTPAWASGASMSANNWFSLPPRRPAAYGVFAAAVAARYGADGRFWREHPSVPRYLPTGIELWNEENLSGDWGDRTPSPAVYAAMVKAAYTRIKKADPKMTVLLGGLAPAGGYDDVTCTGRKGTGHDRTSWNPVNYLQALYADGIHGYFDALAWHSYNYWTGATAAGMLRYNLCSAWSQMARTPVSARSLMVSHGDARKRIWITETGAPTCVAGLTYVCVSEAQQADLAAREAALWKGLFWAGGFYWYDIRDDHLLVTRREAHFGAVFSDKTPKPAYGALRRAWR